MQKLKTDPWFKVFNSLNKSDQDKVIKEVCLRLKLTYELPEAYREARREYRELILNNKELFKNLKARLSK